MVAVREFGAAAVFAVAFFQPLTGAASQDVTMPTQPQIVGGSIAQSCEWPSSIALRGGGCSGSLIHPQVVLSAAHCGSPGSVQFGEDWDSPAATAPVEFCARFPSWMLGNGTDIMVCKLGGSVNIPIVPIMAGCDRRELEPGVDLIPVGFGRTADQGGSIGDKKWVDAELLGFPNNGTMIGISGQSLDEGTCNGDSGGSLYFQMADGTWRMIAITSTGDQVCPGFSQHVPTWALAVEFIEETTGIDVTPCSDVDGTWNPGPDCTGFPTNPGSGAGQSWSNGCTDAAVSGPVSTCGPAFGEPPDTNPPEVVITAPEDNAELAADIGSVPVTLSVVDPDGWGVRDVLFTVEGDAGKEEVFLEAEPWEIGTVDLPVGEWTLSVAGRDWSGNESLHTITIFVGLDAPPEPETTDDGADDGADDGDGGGAGGGTGGGTGTGSGADGGNSGGGGCHLGGAAAAPWLVFILGLALRRRTERTTG